MDCEYLLVIKSNGKWLSSEPFHSPTPEQAETLATEKVRRAQAEGVDEFPFAPKIMKGELYRQIKEINGAQFIKMADSHS